MIAAALSTHDRRSEISKCTTASRERKKKQGHPDRWAGHGEEGGPFERRPSDGDVLEMMHVCLAGWLACRRVLAFRGEGRGAGLGMQMQQSIRLVASRMRSRERMMCASDGRRPFRPIGPGADQPVMPLQLLRHCAPPAVAPVSRGPQHPQQQLELSSSGASHRASSNGAL